MPREATLRVNSYTPASVPESDKLKCLWIGRNIPYPLDEGAKVYSAKLAESLAAAGASIRFLGFGDTAAVPSTTLNVEWVSVPKDRRSGIVALLSSLPNQAAVDATEAYVALLDAQLRERWDAIVLDSYGAGWALNRCLAYRAASGDRRPILVHVSHNHEEALWRSMAREARGFALRRLALWQNFRRVCALERRIVRNVDLLTTITDEDRRALGARLGEGHTLTLTPGYTGWVVNERLISTDTPRRVIIVGSFHWVVKQENLRRFVELADPVFSQHGIELDIVGAIPSDLLAKLKAHCRATRFHGFVADIAPILAQARMAVVPEPIGGGFKLKLLDYIFGRVPVATVSQAAAGLPPAIRRETLECADLPRLVRGIVWQIDRIDELNRMQERAFTHAQTQFRWEHRGQQLRRAISRLTRPANVAPEWAK